MVDAALPVPKIFRKAYLVPGSEELTREDERWFFVNGVLVQPELARESQATLESLFGRRIDLVYNPTHSLLQDVLIESTLGRTFDWPSDPAYVLLRELWSALNAGHRVVCVAHSQGSIIAITSTIAKTEILPALRSTTEIPSC